MSFAEFKNSVEGQMLFFHMATKALFLPFKVINNFLGVIVSRTYHGLILANIWEELL
jgi:hypothetical protein